MHEFCEAPLQRAFRIESTTADVPCSWLPPKRCSVLKMRQFASRQKVHVAGHFHALLELLVAQQTAFAPEDFEAVRGFKGFEGPK